MKKKCIVFIIGYSASRYGLDGDVRSIEETFKHLFDPEIIKWIDLPSDEIKARYKTFRNEKQSEFHAADFVIIFCLAHGDQEGQILCGDKITDARRSLLNPLFKLKELDGKLKWLVVQSCRGKLNDYKPSDYDGKTDYYPDYFYVSYCTGEGTISYQYNDIDGKIFIQSLCEELRENCKMLSISQILKKVNVAVKDYGEMHAFQNFCKATYITNCEEFKL